jgi:hypothetical protein
MRTDRLLIGRCWRNGKIDSLAQCEVEPGTLVDSQSPPLSLPVSDVSHLQNNLDTGDFLRISVQSILLRLIARERQCSELSLSITQP